MPGAAQALSAQPVAMVGLDTFIINLISLQADVRDGSVDFQRLGSCLTSLASTASEAAEHHALAPSLPMKLQSRLIWEMLQLTCKTFPKT